MEHDRHSPLADDQSPDELYEHAPCGYLSVAGDDGRIVRVNATLLSWTGHTREQLVGQRRFTDLLPAGARIYYETHVVPLLHMQGAVREVAFDLVCADGLRVPVLLHATLVRGAQLADTRLRMTLFNASERRAYERELLAERRRADDAAMAKARFISVLSHEIRNPLTAIFNVTDVIARTSTDRKQQHAIEVLKASTRELADLVTNVLDLNRIEAGKLPLQEHAFELHPYLRWIVAQANARAEAKGIELVVAVDPAIPHHLVGDHVKLRQVLTNLLGNAVKFTQQGRVGLRVELVARTGQRARIRFTVSDTGVGIPAERLPQLFQDFTQGSYDIAAHYGGTGLGLAICKRLLALYGSQIEVSSQPEQGSEFRFELELGVTHEREPEAALHGAPQLRGLSVLLVEDNQLDALAVSALLGSWGLSLSAAADIAQAVELVRRHHYDAILMDRTIPGLGGDSAARILRRSPHPAGSEPHIIALTTGDRALDRHELTAAGFDDVLHKPVASESLMRALQRHCSRAP